MNEIRLIDTDSPPIFLLSIDAQDMKICLHLYEILIHMNNYSCVYMCERDLGDVNIVY